MVRNDVRWIKNSKGIEFLKIGQAVSNSSTQEFFDPLIKGSGLTLEVWLKTEDLNQSGPARILSYSKDTGLRNFTIGQSRDNLVFRLRTTETNLNGTNPDLIIEEAFNYRSMQHMVIMYDFLEQRVYIDGEQRTRSKILKGSFSNWDRSCSLVIGNEATGNRPWKGKIYYAAVFNRSLTEQEIRQNYLSGLWSKTNKGSIKHTGFKAKGPIVRYLFDEGKEGMIHDSGLLSNPVNLYIPKYIKHKMAPFLSGSIGSLKSQSPFSGIIINILIFIPLGILIHGMLRARYGLALKISLATLLAGTLFTIGVESLQYFSMTRNSELIDVFTNMTGTTIGIVIDRVYNLFLNYKAKRLQMLLYDRTE
ncbi:MAG: VanZ family protein [Deltaproteobacteria bacterium]|nr:VanZ family protein [Deltaproteobacteria bacterium]